MPRQKKIENFDKGTISNIEAQSIPNGAASDSLNWLTLGDQIVLRGGQIRLGDEVTGSGRITGLIVSHKADDSEVVFRSRGKKIEHLNSSDIWTELGSDVLTNDGDGLDVSFTEYSSLAGFQTWANCAVAGPFKMMNANPGDITDMYDSTKNYRGFIKAKLNAMFLWNIDDVDKTGLRRSYIDKDEYTDYTQVSAESIGTGDGTTVTFTGTLAFKAGDGQRTCFQISATDSTETFTDDRSGNLTGDLGGTGTINYTTGAFSITFNTAPANTQAITATYRWEDSTDAGVADFSESSPRSAGEGFVLRQDDGGELHNLYTINDDEYCMHKRKTWRMALSVDDTELTNRIYRNKVGIPYIAGGLDTGDGIYYVDNTNENDAKVRLLALDSESTNVIPLDISQGITLEDYRFDKVSFHEFADFILMSCRHKDSTSNDTVWAYNRLWKTWDRLDYLVSFFANYNNGLIGGDSIGNNVYKLFSGTDDEDSPIPNFWNGNISRLDLERLKKCKKLIVEGLIGVDQVLKVSLSLDRGEFVEIGTIAGNGDFVDTGTEVTIGSVIIGANEVGGGGDGVTASHYKAELKLNQDKFDEVQVRFEATNVGYCSVSLYNFYDIRGYSDKLPTKYRQT